MSRAPTRRRNLIALVVLLVALVAGTGLRVHAQSASPNVQHDEAWSFASASGRLGPFLTAMDGGLTGRWVPASDWQYFWQSGDGDVGNIAPDLAAYDVHPPLYFGLLHAWLAVTGLHVWAGRALNLIFTALTVLCILGLARRLGFEKLEGSLAALVWAVSPAVVSVSSLTRQYDLVALTTVLLVWGLVHVAAPRQGRPRDDEALGRALTWLGILWLAAATAAALLTHYQAVLLVAGGVLYGLSGVLLPGGDAQRRPWWPPLLGLVAGSIAAALLSPGWHDAFGRERSRLGEISVSAFFGKLEAIGQTLGRFIAVPGLVVGLAIAALIVLALVPRTRRTLALRMRSARPGWATILFFLLVTAGGIALQNLLFLSLPPRISARYLAMAWPFAAFLPLLFFGIWPRMRYVLTAGFCVFVLVPASIATPLLYGGADRLPLQQLADADAVLVDNVGVGELPRFLWFVPGDAPVFAGTQEELLDGKDAWRDAQLGEKAYYVSILRMGGLRWRRNRILVNLRRTHDVTLAGSNGMAEIYAITPKAVL